MVSANSNQYSQQIWINIYHFNSCWLKFLSPKLSQSFYQLLLIQQNNSYLNWFQINFLQQQIAKKMKVLENNAKISQIESILTKYSYLSKHTLPGYADGKVFQTIQSIKRYPDRKISPNFYHWFILMKQFSHNTISKWIKDELFNDPEESLISEFIKLYHSRKDSIAEPSQNISPQNRSNKMQNSAEYEYTFDITVKNSSQEKINSMRKILEEYKAQITQIQQKDQAKLFRVLCRTGHNNSQQMIEKVSKFIEYGNLEIKRPKKLNNPLLPLQKNQ